MLKNICLNKIDDLKLLLIYMGKLKLNLTVWKYTNMEKKKIKKRSSGDDFIFCQC